MSSYYNTNKESGETIKKSQRKAKSQEERILAYFIERPMVRMTPDAVKDKVLPEALITSVKRALSNLSSDKWDYALIKTNEMIKGPNGKDVHTWGLKPGLEQDNQLKLL